MAPKLVTQFLPFRVRHSLRQLQAHVKHQRDQIRHRLHQRHLRQLWMQTGAKWSVDHVVLDRDKLEISGWAYVPPADRGQVWFTWNDRPFDWVDYGMPRADLAGAMPFVEGIAETAFRCGSRLPSNWAAPGAHLTFRCIDRETGRTLANPNHPFSFQVPAAGEVLPEPNQRVRVMRYSEEMSFRIGGYTLYNQLRRALMHAVGRDITHCDHVLDWGCGCGRVSRYFRPPTEFTGVDVDPDNAQWCARHLPHGRYQTIPLYPPTALPDATFDFVFGISVMTHLRETTQLKWLAELHRITRPGGVVMLSFHGDATTCLCRASAQVCKTLKTDGFVDMVNTAYDADLDEKNYYRDILQTSDHVRRVWGKQFQVLDILPTFIFHQDMAILRKA